MGGRVVDPSQNMDRQVSLVVEDDRIAGLGGLPREGDRVIDATGKLIFPGLIDMHVHLREPGMTDAEDVRSGTLAAAAGGFTTVVCMPNTKPVMDRKEHLDILFDAIQKHALVRVVPSAAISLGLEGRRLTAIEKLAAMGVKVLSDDGIGTENMALLHEALGRAASLGLPVLTHCEDHGLRGRGVMHAGDCAERMDISGMSSESEYRAVHKAIDCNRKARAKLHIQHVSTRETVEAVLRAKEMDIPISAEVTPHHIYLTDANVEQSWTDSGPDPNLKMNPPLRSEDDRRSLLRGLADGSLDVIASDHAPHSREAKKSGFIQAPFGVIGLETTLPLVLQLAEDGHLGLSEALRTMTVAPAAILGLEAGTLVSGMPADITIVDPDEVWNVVPSNLQSRSKNSSFLGWKLKGKAVCTIVGGKIVYRAGI